MTHNITMIQWISIAFILLPIAILWVNNQVLSARQPSSQMLLTGTLVFALIAAESSNILMLVFSIALFTLYTFTLCQYYATALSFSKKREQMPHGKRP